MNRAFRGAPGRSGLFLFLAFAAWTGNALYALGAPGGWLKEYSPALVATAMIAFVILHGRRRYGGEALWRFTLIVFVIAWVFETVSVLTGFPFGRYHYTEVMAPFLWHVPVFVLPAYFLMAYLSWSLATLLLGRRGARPDRVGLFAVPLLAAGAMVTWDLSMDILRSTVEQRWVWIDGGPHFGVPVSNYLGWFGVTWLMFQSFAVYLRRRAPEGWPAEPEGRAFWLSVPLAYAAFAGEYLLNPFTGTAVGLVAQVNGGDVAVDALFSGAATVCLLTMVPLALGGIWAAWRPRGVPVERPVSPGRRQAS